MKKSIRSAAFILVTVLLIISTVLPAFAATQPTTYSDSKNSGTRHVLCTTLDGTGAEDYYQGSYAYEALEDLSASALLSTLRSYMTSTHKRLTSYANCRDYSDETDCQGGDGSIVTIYTSYVTSHSQYNSGSGWNREHVWPKSLGGFDEVGPGADLHHIRPSENNTNSKRGNKLYGNVSGGTAAKGNLSGDIGGYYSGNYYEPLDEVKGDVARICLYVYVRWGGDRSYGCGNINSVFDDVDTLLEWCELDPVDTWEMGRNEVVENIQGNRNVFIDYPELAWLIFDREVPDDMDTPSGKAKGGESGGNTDTSCKHTDTEIRDAEDASCGDDGYTGDTYCKDCDEKIGTGKVIPATEDHTYGDWMDHPTDDGMVIRICIVCGDEDTKAEDKICTHIGTKLKDAKPATCSEEGYTGDKYCIACGEKIATGQVIPKNDDHTFGDWMEHPATENLLIRFCMICGEEETKEDVTDTIPECDHAQSEIRNATSPTCTEEGYTGDRYCTLCGELTESGSAIPATGHSFGEAEVTKPATEEEEGEEKQVCESCGEENITAIPKLEPTEEPTTFFGRILAAIKNFFAMLADLFS